jgi:hypothetical protein
MNFDNRTIAIYATFTQPNYSTLRAGSDGKRQLQSVIRLRISLMGSLGRPTVGIIQQQKFADCQHRWCVPGSRHLASSRLFHVRGRQV